MWELAQTSYKKCYKSDLPKASCFIKKKESD